MLESDMTYNDELSVMKAHASTIGSFALSGCLNSFSLQEAGSKDEQ